VTDAGRLDRWNNLQWGDALLDIARDMARCYADADGTLAPHILATHRNRLRNAARCYRDAELGLLAGRVRWLSQRNNVADAWQKFDRLNAGGCGVT
jgi:hypothetical protein